MTCSPRNLPDAQNCGTIVKMTRNAAKNSFDRNVAGCPLTFLLVCCAVLIFCHPLPAQAGFAVITNRCSRSVSFSLAEPQSSAQRPRQRTIEPGDVVSLVLSEPAELTYQAAGSQKSHAIAPNGIYYFGNIQGEAVELHEIGLTSPQSAPYEAWRVDSESRVNGSVNRAPSGQPPNVVIPVKILFDEDEVRKPSVWEKRMRARFDEASRIFAQHCFVQFKIVVVGSWGSDDTIDDLEKSLAEFERTVDPAPARLAIGFTGQIKPRVIYPHLGGTRGPLHTHMLVREWVSRNSEAECLEVLVHELGHFLGAVHSPEPNSVMRSQLGDRQARSAKFRIVFDPLNTLAMCLVGEELGIQPQIKFFEMRNSTRNQLRKLYTELGRALPQDPTPLLYRRRLDAGHQTAE